MGTKIKEFRQYNNLFTELVRKGIKLKYRRSYLGIVWSMIEPLLTMIVLTLVFGTLLGHKEKIISGLYPDRTADVYAVFAVNDVCLKVHPSE